MQYTLRNVPPELDVALRQRARAEHKSLNEVALEALFESFALRGMRLKRRDLSDIAGTWVEDPETEVALADQRQLDPELWP